MDEASRAVLQIGIVLILATASGWLARRVDLPAVVGYLLTGLVVSPFTPGYVADRGQIQLLAQIGVVLLLFEVGIEIDPLRLRSEHGPLLWMAPLQTVLTTALATVAFLLLHVNIQGALLLALSLALSSSVVVINITRSQRRTTSEETERTLLAWSLLQDMAGVAVAITVLAFVAGRSSPAPLVVGRIVLFLLIAVLASWLLPRLLRQLETPRDLFLMLSVGSGLGLAGVGAALGLPLALAAFVAGLVISEGPATSEARQRLLPFRDLFAVFFFVSVGTLIDPTKVLGALPWLGLLLSLMILVKVLPIYVLGTLARNAAANPFQLAVGLGQIGEFSFVLVSVGVTTGALGRSVYTAVLSAVVLTIGLSSILVRRLFPNEASERLPSERSPFVRESSQV